MYYFAHLNSSTHKMVGRFKAECGDANWIKGDSIDDVSRLPEMIVVLSTASIATCLSRVRAARGGGDGGAYGSGYVPMPVCPTEPDWSRVEVVRCTPCRTAAVQCALGLWGFGALGPAGAAQRPCFCSPYDTWLMRTIAPGLQNCGIDARPLVCPARSPHAGVRNVLPNEA